MAFRNATGLKLSYYSIRFAEILTAAQPAYAGFLVSPRGKQGFLEIFEAPRPGHDGESLVVIDRTDAIEFIWNFPHTRGPAELHFVESHPHDDALVRTVVSEVVAILEGRTRVIMRRQRLGAESSLVATFSRSGEPQPSLNAGVAIQWRHFE